jgi:outer membrane protein insertion porin family
MLKTKKLFVYLLIFFGCMFLYADNIEKINIIGNKRISDEAVFYRIKSEEGKPLSADTISEDIKRLWDLQVFADIVVDVKDGENGKIVTFLFKERPIIKDYNFLGNHVYGPNLLKDKLQEKGVVLRNNAQVDYEQISKTKKAIIELYKEKGYQNIQVKDDVELAAGNTAYITFHIIEGSKIHIYEIKFSGNKALSDKKIKKAMEKLAEHGMFSFFSSKDTYSDEKFEEDLENIKKAYWEKGYKDIFIGKPVIEIKDFTSEKQKEKNKKRLARNKKVKEDIRMFMTIPVFEGEQYFMGQVSFVDNKLLSDEALLQMWKVKQGDVYNLTAINEFQKDISELYNNSGYLQFVMQQIPQVKEGNIIDLTFKFDEGKQFRMNRLEFEGNIITRDKVLRREVMIPEGGVFKVEAFKNSMLRINQLGFFDISKSDPSIDLNPENNTVDVVIKGEESGVNEINFGGGYSEYAGLFLQASYSTRNFLGRGEQLSLSTNLGSYITSYNLAFSEPWIFDYPHSFSVNFFKSDTEYYNFTRNSSGFSVGFGFRLKTFLTYGVSYKYELVDVPGSSVMNSDVFKPIKNRLTSSITQSLAFNTLNNPYMPTKGSKYQISFEYAGWEFGGDNLKYQLTFRGTKLFDAFKKTFFMVNTRIAYQEALKGAEENFIPYYDRYFIGGENTVRGYDYRRIAPTDPDYPSETIGGTKMFVANLEWVLPIENKFQFALFFDVGGVWLEDESFFASSQTLHKSFGVEARFNLPVFQLPIRLIYGYPLDPVYGQTKSGNIQFTIGTLF